MDSLYFNGSIQSLDPKGTIYQAAGVKFGRIAALGTNEDLRKKVNSKTRLIDLKGATLLPGLIDSHMHPLFHGYLMDGLDLSISRVRNIPDILSLVKEKCETTPENDWIVGSGYAEYNLAENRHPNRYDLDRASPNHPVILNHLSLNAYVLNSRGLVAFGIGRNSPDPEKGMIVRDPATNEPTGVIHNMDGMVSLFQAGLSKMTLAERLTLIERTMDVYASLGLVGVTDAEVSPESFSLYKEALQAGRLKLRIVTLHDVDLSESLIQTGDKLDLKDDRLAIAGIKIFADGGISNRTAAVREPYLTGQRDTGLLFYSQDELACLIRDLDDSGFQVAVHAQGDRCMETVLNAFENVLGQRSSNPFRHRIEHAGCLFGNSIQRASDMNLAMGIQPPFIHDLGDGIIESLGEERANRVFPFKSLLQAGIHLGAGSDCPITFPDPRQGIRDAVLRRTRSGASLGASEALTVEQALKLYTIGSSYIGSSEHNRGAIEFGRQADFTIMGDDPLQVPPAELVDIPIVMTVVGDEIVYHSQ